MKAITPNLLRFALTLTVYTIVFRFTLSWLLTNQHFTLVWFLAVVYGAIIFITAWILGKKDHESLPLYDIGFRIHFTTYLVCNIIGELWFLLGFNSRYESIYVVHMTALGWGIGLLIHYIFYLYTRKKTIAGLEKSEIFE